MIERLAWTVAEVAESLRVSDKQVYALLKAGELKYLPVGKHYRIPDEELRRYITEKTNA